MSLIRLTDVDFSYRRGRRQIPVLRGFNLEIADGECVAVLGESGSGKSTVLALLSGLQVPAAGAVEVLGVRLDQLDSRRRAAFRLDHVAQIYQDFGLMPGLTALENVALLIRLKGVGPAEANEEARAALKAVGMAHRGDHLPSELSGGEQQRVAIARAVVAKPAILLADEPTGALDAGRRDEILDLMLSQLSRATTLLVTHDPTVAARADRVIRMDSAMAMPDLS